MGVRDTLRWAKTEWGIFSDARRMSLQDRVRWVQQWVPFGARTVAYGSLSLLAGPLTTEHRASQWAARRWSRESLHSLGIAVEVDGLEHVPGGSFVYASNHQSLLDILVLGAVLPGDFKWATKRSVMNVPFLGWHLRLAGHVPVERQQGKSTAVVVAERFERVLRAGKPLLIFPEGTRSSDGEIKEFKNGGFFAAVRAGAPVVPVALEGTHDLMGKHDVDTGELSDRARRVVRVRLGAPLAAVGEGEELDRVVELRERTRETILALHGGLRRAARGGTG